MPRASARVADSIEPWTAQNPPGLPGAPKGLQGLPRTSRKPPNPPPTPPPGTPWNLLCRAPPNSLKHPGTHPGDSPNPPRVSRNPGTTRSPEPLQNQPAPQSLQEIPGPPSNLQGLPRTSSPSRSFLGSRALFAAGGPPARAASGGVAFVVDVFVDLRRLSSFSVSRRVPRPRAVFGPQDPQKRIREKKKRRERAAS